MVRFYLNNREAERENERINKNECVTVSASYTQYSPTCFRFSVVGLGLHSTDLSNFIIGVGIRDCVETAR